MAAAYAPDVHFRDPAFGDLHGEEPGAMWRMLTGRSEDLEIELVDHDDTSAHWLAHYTFSTGRHVDNDVRASFKFNDEGKISEHIDEFDFYAWARQALGPGRPAAGLDADHQGRRAQEGERSARRVHGAVAQVDDPPPKRRWSSSSSRSPAGRAALPAAHHHGVEKEVALVHQARRQRLGGQVRGRPPRCRPPADSFIPRTAPGSNSRSIRVRALDGASSVRE